MATIQCNIVSPEGELFSGPVELLSAEGGAGEIAITPRHAPLLTNLKPGPVKLVLEGGEEEIFFASGGFLEVQPGEVTLLTDVAERADDIDSIIKNYEKTNIKLIIYNMQTSPNKVVDAINNLNNHLVVGIGNIVGWGDEFLSEIKKYKIK